MTTVDLLALILTSGFAGAFVPSLVKNIFNIKKTDAGTLKLKNEAGQIILEGELRVTEFYKEQLDAILEKYNQLEIRFNEKASEHQQCEERISVLDLKYNDLQRQFTLLKTQLVALTNG